MEVRKIEVVQTDRVAREKVDKVVKVLEGLVIDWAEVDSWDGFRIQGKKGETEIEIKGYLEGEEEYYMLQIREGPKTQKIHICGAIYDALKQLAEEINDKHFQQMRDIWEKIEIERKELR